MYLLLPARVISFVFLFPLLYFFTFADQEYLSFQSRVQEIFNKNESSVVRVKATGENIVGAKKTRLLKMGSGFFISKDGHILTTGLLQNPQRVWIEYDKSYFLTEYLGTDSQCNLSLLKTIEKPKDFQFVSFESSESTVGVGTFLIGLTCALEFETGPTFGLMQSYESSFGRNLFPTKMLRSSLSLGPGEVGGPVFDLYGNFVGITYAALPDLKSSFILNARACSKIRDGLLLSGKVDYGWFGITVSRKLNQENGFNIEIKSVISESKLQEGDLIIKIGNKEIFNRGDIVDATFYARPGTFVEFLVLRNGKELTVPVRVSRRPPSVPDKISTKNTSLKAQSLNPSIESTKSLESKKTE
jgi:S1-C subfamily serine protease